MSAGAAYAAGGMAVLGGIVGSKSKKARQVTDFERQASGHAQGALNSFASMAAQAGTAQDVAAGAQSQRDLGAILKQYQNGGMYDMAAGKTLSNQVFGTQRQALQMAFQDQMAQANKAAALAGRSSNDPILRAKLAQEHMRQSMALEQSQAQATLDFARQSVTDTIGLAGQRASVLSGLGAQAMGAQNSLFSMAQNALQSERALSWQEQQFQATKGGGFMGALSGAMQGAAAGMAMAQGMGGGGGGGGTGGATGGNSFMSGMGQGLGGALGSYSMSQLSPMNQPQPQVPFYQMGTGMAAPAAAPAPNFSHLAAGGWTPQYSMPYAPGAATVGPWAPR